MALKSSSRFDFSDVIQGYLRSLDGLTAEALTTVIPKVAKESAKKLKQVSPRGATGKYAQGWTHTVEKGRIMVGATVHGKKPTYALAHLLEVGHLDRTGRRTIEAKPHIADVESWAIDEAINQFIDYMENHTI